MARGLFCLAFLVVFYFFLLFSFFPLFRISLDTRPQLHTWSAATVLNKDFLRFCFSEEERNIGLDFSEWSCEMRWVERRLLCVSPSVHVRASHAGRVGAR
ncbi:hypothetical protein N658DRAFT_491673 [Parathielavia hyrcaniae]|uniref:Uncharacterized protein n=1 Tax=Parathielavia hyrcaniae TaxID=113614 RepID=A0AAN6T4U3_9PEZI|nr:hypothetical protein N658DRAFT_491673 [Parathielavia hyrcaniae]